MLQITEIITAIREILTVTFSWVKCKKMSLHSVVDVAPSVPYNACSGLQSDFSKCDLGDVAGG